MFLLSCFIVAAISCGANVQAVQVKISQGILEGTTESFVTGDGSYLSFKGIPYAAPPVGTLRFLAPSAPLNWTGVRNASTHGSVCPQQDFTTGAVIGNEDCLFLNVYTPTLKSNKTRLPVMVYIHGGGFISDSGNVGNYGPDFLVQKNVVVVTMNYRLGALGFLSLNSPLVPGNAGLKDQVAALRWVQSNIANFGGNNRNVTIFGQSVGGTSVCLHMLSPMSAGLFRRAISMSGCALNEFALPFEAERRAFSVGRLLGHETTNKTDLLSFLQSVNASSFVGLRPNVLVNEEQTRFILKMFYYTYVIESDFDEGDHFLTEDPLDSLNDGDAFDVDFMIGHTNKEAVTLYSADLATKYAKYRELFAPDRILDNATPSASLKAADTLKTFYFGSEPVSNATYENHIQYFSDTNYNYDIYKFLSILGDSSTHSRYLYQFSAVTSRNVYGSSGVSTLGVTPGAGHFDDVFYLFDPKSFKLTISANSTEYKLVQEYSTLFTNFAKYGNPTPSWIKNNKFIGTTSWSKYSSTGKKYLDFGTTSMNTTATGLDSAAIALFDSVYDTVRIDY